MSLQKILLLSVFTGCCLFAVAQGTGEIAPSPAPSFAITTIPIRNVLREYNIGIMKSIDAEHTLELNFGYVHKNDFAHNVLLEPWFTSPDMQFHGPSVGVQWNQWKFNPRGKRTYWGLIATYRYLWYHDRGLWKGGTGGSSFSELITLSQWRNEVQLLITKGWQTSRFTSFDFSAGIRLMYTHSNVSDTRFRFPDMDDAEYESYRAAQVNDVPFAEGFGVMPAVRITWKLGIFGR